MINSMEMDKALMKMITVMTVEAQVLERMRAGDLLENMTEQDMNTYLDDSYDNINQAINKVREEVSDEYAEG
jgi:hypothetical protein